ncbi:nitrate- and nitrite sensing domain-containing protein [Nonomuraea ferruginea]
MLNRFGDLDGLRDQAIEADLLPAPAVELYTTVINDLLSIHDELVSGSQDDELFRQTRMLDALARVKESVSLQQALLTTALVEGSFGQEQLKTFLGELSREENQREAFSEEATAGERRFFDETVNGRSADDMLFLRELVLIRATAGQTLRGLDLAKRDDAGQWFEASTVVIDSLRTVEQRQAARHPQPQRVAQLRRAAERVPDRGRGHRPAHRRPGDHHRGGALPCPPAAPAARRGPGDRRKAAARLRPAPAGVP